MSRREPMPAWASTLCSFGASGSAASTRLLAASSVSTGASASASNSPARTLAKTSPASGGATGCRCSGSGPSKFGGSGSARRGRLPSPPPSPPPSPRRRSRRPRRRLRSPRSPSPRSPSPRSPPRRARLRPGAPRRHRPPRRRRRDCARRGRPALPPSRRLRNRLAARRCQIGSWVGSRAGSEGVAGESGGSSDAGSASASASPAASANDSEDWAASAASASWPADRRVAGAVERRQLVEALQAEVVEQLAGGGEQRRPAGRLAVADRLDPAAVLELLDDRAGDGDAADLLDVAAGHRLAVGNDRQRFQDRARIARRPLGAQARQVGGHLRTALEAPAARQLDQGDALVGVLAGRARRAARARCRCRSRRRTARRARAGTSAGRSR